MSGAVERERSFWNARGTRVRDRPQPDRPQHRRLLELRRARVDLRPGRPARPRLRLRARRGRDRARARAAPPTSPASTSPTPRSSTRATRREAAGVADRTRFVVADAHATGVRRRRLRRDPRQQHPAPPRLEPALLELRRILAPGGRAVFVEPLAHNPLLRLGRALTPMARTEDEHPFTARRLGDLRGRLPRLPALRARAAHDPADAAQPRPARERAQRALADAREGRGRPRAPARARLRRYARLTFLILE